jgi:ubiquinone/menaquinone biosynthesis C-methylase UbiE
VLTTVYDAAAPTFERHRALPEGTVHAIRAAVLAAIDVPRPRLLDLGAGTGRIGWPFVQAGDDYVGVDLSFGMLRAFQERIDREDGRVPRLVQSDGQLLPFADAAFDAVLMVQVFGGLRGWRRLLAEARRVLRPPGTLIAGRTMTPDDGVDAQMKAHLAGLLDAMNVTADRMNAREGVEQLLDSSAHSATRVIAAAWDAQRTARGFLDRHRTGARFSTLPDAIKTEALARLADWAMASFGSLDAVSHERHAFELRIFRFHDRMG